MATTKSKKITVAEFEAMFEPVKNWGRWGKDDDRGTLNYITPEHVRKAAGLVRSGPFNEVETPPNRLRWNPLSVPDAPTDFLDGLITLAGSGEPASSSQTERP